MTRAIEQLPPQTVLLMTFLVFLGPFLVVMSFPSRLDVVIDKSSYLVFHNITEFFSIMVSLSVFSVGWYTYDQSRDRHALFLGTAFLAVGLLDFMHTMSNAAMPAFLTPNSTNKSTQFWIAARLFDASAFLISAFVYAGSQNRWLTKKALLASALVVTGLVFTGVIFFPSLLPATALPEIGLTPLKRFLEFLIILLLIAAALAYGKRMMRTKDRALIYYPAAFIICIFSEGVFASYKTGFDTYNVLGHIYKVAAFYLIYQGVFVASVNKPYANLHDAHEKLRTEAVSRHEMEKEIEERKHAEEELRHAYASLRRFFDHRIGGIGIVIAKASGEIIEANDYYLKILGCTRKQLLNNKVQWREATPPEWLPADEKALAQLRERGVCDTYEKEYLRGDGTRVPVLITDVMMPGERGEILAFVLDITERKKAEINILKLNEDMAARNLELESANQELESFIYSVSHDLRAPLRSVSGFTKIVSEDYAQALDEKGRDYLTRIHKGAEKMSKLIDDLLHLSRISKQDLTRTQVDLSRLADQSMAELRQGQPDRSVVVNIQEELIAVADQRLIAIALTNLLGNAWKFTSKTQNARIEFGAFEYGRPNAKFGMKHTSAVKPGETVYYVRDNGAGFDPSYASKMFLPFHRLHAESEFEGTGIGLTIVERVIRRHNGTIWAEGNIDTGAAIFFTLG